MKNFIIIFFYSLFLVAFGNLKAQDNYESIKKKYENYSENDENAIPYVNSYIQKAKQEYN